MAMLSLFAGGLYRSGADAGVVTPTGEWQEPAYTFIAPRPSASSRWAGDASAESDDELFLAVDVSRLLESELGAATIESAACSVSDGGATVGELALNESGTAVGAMFTDFVAGPAAATYTVTWIVVLTDGSRREVRGGLIVAA